MEPLSTSYGLSMAGTNYYCGQRQRSAEVLACELSQQSFTGAQDEQVVSAGLRRDETSPSGVGEGLTPC